MQKWAKKGLIYSETRAQVPVVFKKSNKVWRIYFSNRDEHNKSYIDYLDVAAGNLKRVLKQPTGTPLIPLGPPGSFDVSGTMPSCVIKTGNYVRLYYLGWTLRKDVPYFNSVGLAISSDNGTTFEKYSEGPLLGPTAEEPGFTGTSCVIKTDAQYHNYYLYCTGWHDINGKMEPRYRLNQAVSDDGVYWNRFNVPAIDFKTEDEGGIAGASVIKDKDLYRMWYCYRDIKDYRTDPSRSYKIGYAESSNAREWTRLDQQIDLSGSNSWDSDMQCYPNVIEHKGLYYMFYNGNGFGSTGIGYATSSGFD